MRQPDPKILQAIVADKTFSKVIRGLAQAALERRDREVDDATSGRDFGVLR